MTAALLCAAIGGVSFFTGVGVHHDYPGTDPVFGFSAHLGYRPPDAGFAFIAVAQALTLPVQSNDEEFPESWRRTFAGLGLGVQWERGPVGAQVSLGPAFGTDHYGPGGGNDSGLVLSFTGSLALWRWVRLQASLTHWIIASIGGDYGATTVCGGIGASF